MFQRYIHHNTFITYSDRLTGGIRSRDTRVEQFIVRMGHKNQDELKADFRQEARVRMLAKERSGDGAKATSSPYSLIGVPIHLLGCKIHKQL